MGGGCIPLGRPRTPFDRLCSRRLQPCSVTSIRVHTPVQQQSHAPTRTPNTFSRFPANVTRLLLSSTSPPPNFENPKPFRTCRFCIPVTVCVNSTNVFCANTYVVRARFRRRNGEKYRGECEIREGEDTRGIESGRGQRCPARVVVGAMRRAGRGGPGERANE